MVDTERTKKLIELFERMDSDNSGKVSMDELKAELAKSGMAQITIQRTMRKLDGNKDGIITFDEYTEALGLTKGPLAGWRRLFTAIDADRTGSITIGEIEQIFKENAVEIDQGELDKLMTEGDTDGSGSIDYKEFISFVTDKLDD